MTRLPLSISSSHARVGSWETNSVLFPQLAAPVRDLAVGAARLAADHSAASPGRPPLAASPGRPPPSVAAPN